MTTPAGVPNLPIGALTVETLGQRLQDQTAIAMRNRAGEQMPSIFGASNGGDILSDLSPFGILTRIWAEINSRIATADPNDIQGPDDLPPLFTDFIESLPLVGQLVELLEALAGTYTGEDPTLNGVQDLIAPIRLLVDTIGQPIADWLSWLVGTLFNGSTDPLTNIFTALAGLLDDAGELTTWLDGLLTDTWETLLTLLQSLFGGFDLETFLQPLFDFLSWLWNGVTGGFAGLGGAVDTVLKPLTEWLAWLWDLFGDSVDTVLKPAFEFLEWLFGGIFAGAIDTLKNIFTKLLGLVDDAGTLDTWIGQIPLVGPLVSILTGKSPLDGVAMDLGTLGTWARDILTQTTDIPAANLKGLLPAGILSSIPLSNINFDTPNLLSQGDFGNVGTIEANDGWSWDSTQNHSGSGGCAKVTCNGTARRLYSNQVIKVVAGDRINLSSWIKTSSDFSGGTSSIELILVPFAGTSRYTVGGSAVNVYFNQRGSTGNAWAQATGSTVNATAPWTVPAGVTSVRVRLSVTSAATAGSVWFDDIDLHKTGLLSGDWMNGILGTVAQDIQAAVDQLVKGIRGFFPGGASSASLSTGAANSIASVFTTFFQTLFGNFVTALPTNITSNPLLANAIPGLNASKITEGSFGSARIGENAVGTYQIADDAVGTAQIAPDAVTGNEIATNAVGNDQIAPDAVTSTEIADDAVGTAQIADDAVGTAQIATDAVTGNEIANDAIGADQLAPGAVTYIGSEINPTQGSGAQLIRSATEPVAARSINNRNFTPDGFFTSLGQSSTDISCLTTAGVAATGARNDYAGAFKVSISGWYLVEIAYRVNISFGDGGFNVAPVLYKGSNLNLYNISTNPTGQSVYKVGTDAHFVWLFTTSSAQRFVQNSFIVYLNANEIVRSGTDITYSGGNVAPPILGGQSGTGTSGVETYFSISLLNRSFA